MTRIDESQLMDEDAADAQAAAAADAVESALAFKVAGWDESDLMAAFSDDEADTTVCPAPLTTSAAALPATGFAGGRAAAPPGRYAGALAGMSSSSGDWQGSVAGTARQAGSAR
jgi:hypothetical protein